MIAMKLNKEDIYTLTQSLIAIIVVLGGGIAILNDPSLKEVFIGVIGVIIGYYYTGFSNTPIRYQTQADIEEKKQV